ncbi:hypothetical protein [Rhodococcus erythropolis]|uniref:hypothetical protein n=1 Tax=Rhodococcus erythropolis TaxID=1833 RepID=UPI00366FEB14
MSDEVRDEPLHHQVDQSSLQYVETRMMLLELFFQTSHELLEQVEAEHDQAVEAHLMAEAWAMLNAEGRNAGERQADVATRTVETRKAVRVAGLALKKAKALVKGRSEERALLQTRASTLREEMKTLSGRGRT